MELRKIEDGTTTELTWTSEGFSSNESPANHKMGSSSCLERLVQMLARVLRVTMIIVPAGSSTL